MQRFLLVLALVLSGASLIPGVSAVRVGNTTVPELGLLGALALGAAALVLAARRRAAPLRPVAFFAAVAFLAVAAAYLGGAWVELRRPLSPLVARIAAPPSAGGAPLAVAPIDSLVLPERRLLARIAGRRRNFAMDVEGALFVPRAGLHRLQLACDDWCDLRLDGRPVLTGEGSLAGSLELKEGIHRFRLRYRQDAGPAFLVLRWDRPAWLEPLPIEAHLAPTPRVFERPPPRYEPSFSFLLAFSALAWLTAASYCLVRAGESIPSWAARFRAWVKHPGPAAPLALVQPRSWMLASAALLVVGAIGRILLPHRLERLASEYAVSPRRAPFVLSRAESFPDYVFFLAASCLVVGIVFHFARPGAERGKLARRASLWLRTAVVALLLWGAWISQREWERYGRPCYDGYCDYAERVRALAVDPGSETWQAVVGHLRRNYHANSPVGPVLIAAASLAVPDVVASYRLLSAISTIGTLLLLLRIARRDLDLDETSSLVAGFLFVATGAVQRSFLFPQTDAIAMFLVTVAIERLLALRRRVTLRRYATAAGSMAVALLSKLSALPLAGMGAVIVAWPRDGAAVRPLRDGARAALVVVPALVLVAAFALSLRTTGNVRTELVRIETLDTRLSFHAAAFLATLSPFVLAVALTVRRRMGATELALTAAVGVYLAGLWASGASGWERFYLNVLPLALPLAVKRLAPVSELRGAFGVALLLASFTVAHGVRMLLGLYHGA